MVRFVQSVSYTTHKLLFNIHKFPGYSKSISGLLLSLYTISLPRPHVAVFHSSWWDWI